MVVCLSLNAFYRPIIKKTFIKEVFNPNWKTRIQISNNYNSSVVCKNYKNGEKGRNGTATVACAVFTREEGTPQTELKRVCKHCCHRNRFVLLIQQNRSLSTSSTSFQRDVSEPENRKSYELMRFDWIIWPNIIYSIKNWILTKLIIRPYLDRDFTMQGFETGAKQAMLLVTSFISKGQLDSLCGLVSDEALSEIERNYVKLDSDQKQELNFDLEDIYYSFPYQVGIMLEDTDGVQKRLVEITMCYHCLLGSKEMKRIDPQMSEIYKYKDRILIINYRFIKEFTKGRETDWTINVVNYFKPASVM